MTVTPTGSPAWVRNADFAVYGGHPEKRNYEGQGAVDPRTDVTAEEFSRIVADLAAMVRTAPFGRVSFVDRGVAMPPSVERVHMMTGVMTVPYDGDAPPTGFPVVTRTAAGVFNVTFGVTYLDDYGVEAPLTLQHAHVAVLGAQAGAGTYELSEPNVVIVYAFQLDGSAMDDARVDIEVA